MKLQRGETTPRSRLGRVVVARGGEIILARRRRGLVVVIERVLGRGLDQVIGVVETRRVSRHQRRGGDEFEIPKIKPRAHPLADQRELRARF